MSYEYIIQSRKCDIDFINKIIEAYEGIGVVRTLNASKGVISIITTEDFKDFLKTVIIDLDKNYDVEMAIIEENPWSGELYINKK